MIGSAEVLYGQTRTIDARLEVGAATEAVQVTAAVETVNRDNAGVGGLIDAGQIKEIPVSGRKVGIEERLIFDNWAAGVGAELVQREGRERGPSNGERASRPSLRTA